MPEPLTPTPSLVSHLEMYGIRHFSSDIYWQWGAKHLGAELAKELNKLRQPIQKGNASEKQMSRFYDFIAQKNVASVVHSMKAGAIRATGETVEKVIVGARRVFDIGCSIGYLSSYFALADESREVFAWDRSSVTVREACDRAEMLKIKNLRFFLGDIEKARPESEFDAIVSCQTLGGLKRRVAALSNVAACLAPAGLVVCVEALGSANEARDFLTEASDSGLRLSQFTFIYFSDVGEPQAYPCFVLKRAVPAIEIDFDREYSIALSHTTVDANG